MIRTTFVDNLAVKPAEPVHVTTSYDLGVAAATELVYLDSRPSGAYPYRMAVGTDLINAAYGFVMTLSHRMPASDFLPIITGSLSDQADQNRFLRNIGLHLIALSEAFGTPPEPRTHQADLMIIAQQSAMPINEPASDQSAATDAPGATATLTPGAPFLSQEETRHA